MDTDHTWTLIGRFDELAAAERSIELAMGAMDWRRRGSSSGSGDARTLRVFRLGPGYWVETDHDELTMCLLRAQPGCRVYQCTIENRFDDETHGGELCRVDLFGEAPYLRATLEELFEEEDLVRGGVLAEVGLYYLVDFMAAHEDFPSPRGKSPSPITWLCFERPLALANAMVARARRALADASAHEATFRSERWELRLQLPDGSRRILFLTPAEWAELGLD